MDDAVWTSGVQASPQLAEAIRAQLAAFLAPLLAHLDARLDRRLVRTFARGVEALLCWRHRAHGLLLSELGGYLLAPAHAPAGTKRLSNLLRSANWSASCIEQYLWQHADGQLASLEAQGQAGLVVWDESVLEKPESIATPDLGSVRSSKGRRLTRIKPGFYRPPGPPVFVPGLQWIGLLVLGTSGPPTVAAMRWWTNRGPRASDVRTEETHLLDQCEQAWGRRVCHVWDRGFAGSPWLRAALSRSARFVLRWPGRYKLCDGQGRERKAWEIARGQRSWEQRLLWDARHHCQRQTGILALPVRSTDPDLAGSPLWLVVARRGRGQEPWYLLTTEPVQTPEEAWRVVFAYARRWQIEMAWRYGKSELAMESPRLWTWERRQKLLLLATVAYAFLLSLLAPALASLRRWLLRYWCHRTGTRSRTTATPLYRLRSALSRLWQAYTSSPLQNSG